MSTDNAIFEVTSRIIHDLDVGHKCLGVFLDLKKAFDTVNHQLLLEKLHAIGVRGIAHNLFQSYLNSRNQVTKIDDEISENRKIQIGVPQGTILGPILFLIFINDLLKIDLQSYNGTSYSYADDTVVIFSGLTWEEVYKHANAGMNMIKNWLDANLLSLNVSKTTLVPFSLTASGLRQLKSLSNLKLTIHNPICSHSASCNCPYLKESTDVKYLGIIIDQHLKWDKHISYLCTRIRKTIYKFVNLRQYLPTSVLRLVYLTIVESVIQYGICGWGGTAKTIIEPLIILQKRILKICLNKRIDYPTNRIYNEFKVLNIEQIYNHTILNFYHKNRKKYRERPHDYITRRNQIPSLIEPKCFTSAGLLHSSSSGPRLYNSIMKLHPELATYKELIFKSRIKKII